jgi:hypothetical protein
MFGRTLAILVATPLAAQVLVVDRAPVPGAISSQPVERDGGFFGDAFRVGGSGETWMLDAIRLWTPAAPPDSCPAELGDRIAKLTLLGALDNPPVPGQPACDCHALVPIASARLAPGGSRPLDAGARVTPEGRLWRIDFDPVRWSVPGGADVLFSLRASPRKDDACRAAESWSLAAGPADIGYRLHRLDKSGVPQGLAEAATARAIHIQVWAHRTRP